MYLFFPKLFPNPVQPPHRVAHQFPTESKVSRLTIPQTLAFEFSPKAHEFP